MKQPLRIAVADDEPRMREFYQVALQQAGHEVICAAGDGSTLIDFCKTTRPDVIIADVRMPDTDGIEAATEICRDEPIPVILVSAYHDPDLLARASEHHVLAYLVKPIRSEELLPAIAIAMQRFQEFKSLREETASLRQALQDRKVIERAKGVLMKRAKLDEEAAFLRLQKLARERNKKLAEVAEMIITAEQAMI